MRSSVKLVNFDKLQRKLIRMAGSTIARALRPSMASGVQAISAAAKANVTTHRNIRSGLLLQAIQPGSFKRSNQGMTVSHAVGISKKVTGTWSFRWKGKTHTINVKPYKYAHLIEKGFNHWKRGPIAPNPFMAPAYAANRASIVSAMTSAMRGAILRVV
jgi:hypothetical protein